MNLQVYRAKLSAYSSLLLLLGLKELRHFIRWYKTKSPIAKVLIGFGTPLLIWMLSGVLPRCSNSDHSKRKPVSKVNYGLMESSAQPRPFAIKLSGSTGNKNTVNLIAQESGNIVEIAVKDGAFLKAGELILRIDPKNKAKLLDEAKANLQKAEIEFKAADMLFRRKLRSETQLMEATAMLRAAEANLIQAQVSFDSTQVSAPFDGYIDRINVSVGDYVSAITGTNMGVFFSLENAIIKAEASEIDRRYIKQDQKCIIRFSDRQTEGTVRSVSSIAKGETHSFPVEISLPITNEQFISGENVSLAILGETVLAHKVPQSALSLDQTGAIGIKTLSKDHSVKFYAVKLIDEEQDGIWVSGLPEKVDIIHLGHAYIQDGQKLVARREKKN